MITDRRPTHHGRKGALEALPAPKDLYTFNSYCARVFLQWCSHLQVVHGPGLIPIKFIGTFQLHLRRTVSLFLSSMPYMDYVEFVHISEKVHTVSTIWQRLPIYRKNPLLFLSSWEHFSPRSGWSIPWSHIRYWHLLAKMWQSSYYTKATESEKKMEKWKCEVMSTLDKKN